MDASVRGLRTLRDLGVEKAFQQGDRAVLVGPVYELRREPDVFVRMVLLRESKDEVQIGYVRREGDAKGAAAWEIAETKLYSMRTYGYYQRRLKRIGDYVNTPALEGYLEL